MLVWVGDNASVPELTRPLSAMMQPKRVGFFSDDNRASDRGSQGAMVRRLNKKWGRHAKRIDMREFRRLNDGGMFVAEMATRLNVSQRAVRRARKSVARDG